ncbi:MAG: hypothetical protein H0Z33_08790 [Bacillaceae bacterium]|nr:hypothetical protein [Bacillaceae bacterium]
MFETSEYDEYPTEIEGIVNISVNQKDYTHNAAVEIRPHSFNGNRYHSWIYPLQIKHKLTGAEALAIVQRISHPVEKQEESWKWRILFVSQNGEVTEDIFSYQERSGNLYRVQLVNTGVVTPVPLSFKTNVFGWPSLYYPIMFPFLTFVLGIGMVGLSLGKWRSNKNRIELRSLTGTCCVIQRFLK